MKRIITSVTTSPRETTSITGITISTTGTGTHGTARITGDRRSIRGTHPTMDHITIPGEIPGPTRIIKRAGQVHSVFTSEIRGAMAGVITGTTTMDITIRSGTLITATALTGILTAIMDGEVIILAALS